MTPDDVVLEYLASLASATSVLDRAIPWIGRVGTPGALMARTASGEYVRNGEISGLGEFSLHGVGCLIERSDGAMIDFDWDGDGRIVFDPYRLRRFGRSISGPEFTESELAASCRELVDEGILIAFSQNRFARHN